MTTPPRVENFVFDAPPGLEDPRVAAAWFASNKSWILERQLAVCRVAAPTFLEERRAELLKGELAAMGYAASLDAAGNVVALRDAGSQRPLVVVSAHMDTVLAPRRPEDISLNADGSLHGPGSRTTGPGWRLCSPWQSVLNDPNSRRLAVFLVLWQMWAKKAKAISPACAICARVLRLPRVWPESWCWTAGP